MSHKIDIFSQKPTKIHFVNLVKGQKDQGWVYNEMRIIINTLKKTQGVI